MRTVLMVMAGLLALSCSSGQRLGEVIATTAGTYRGSFHPETGVYVFKGIPYAAPPTGKGRWKPPRPAGTQPDTIDATQFTPICMQPDPQPFRMWTREFMPPGDAMSEDCLYLNIWTAEGSRDARRPVIVFIHGGGFVGGSGSVPIYDGEQLARKGAVYVTFNYRLGILGFLAHPELSRESEHGGSGNYGLFDMIAALEWVQKHIDRFGGDPGNVTIAGQSAGAFSVNFLAASPLTRGKFQRMIAQSGGVMLPATAATDDRIALKPAEQRGREAMLRAGAETPAEMRALSPDSLIRLPGSFSPVIDGYLLPAAVGILFEEGEGADLPLLAGWNEDEGNFRGPIQDAYAFRQSIRDRYGRYAEEMLELFPADNDSLARASQLDLGSLLIFGAQTWRWMRMQQQTGRSPVYLYHFRRDLPHAATHQDYGAFHSAELFYTHHTFHKSDRPFTSADYRLADRITSYWVNFARYGDPNGEGLARWPASEPGSYRALYLDDPIAAGPIPFRERLELLEEIFSKRSSDTSR